MNEECKIRAAHRIGVYNPENNYPRVMIVRCTLTLKNIVLETFKVYKEDKEQKKEMPLQFYVNEQLPDMMAEKKNEIRHFIWEQKRKDDHLPKAQKASIKVQNDIVYVNKQPIKHRLPPTKLSETFPDAEMQSQLDEISLAKSDDKTVKGQCISSICGPRELCFRSSSSAPKVKSCKPILLSHNCGICRWRWFICIPG